MKTKDKNVIFTFIIVLSLMCGGLCFMLGYLCRTDIENNRTQGAIQELQGDTVLIKGKVYKLNFEEIK